MSRNHCFTDFRKNGQEGMEDRIGSVGSLYGSRKPDHCGIQGVRVVSAFFEALSL